MIQIKDDNHINNFIMISLAVLSFKVILDLIVSAFEGNFIGISAVGNLFILIFALSQILGMAKKWKYLWIISIFQIICTFLFSEGTFAYLLSYVFRPFFQYQPYHFYIFTAGLIITELLKSIWFFKEFAYSRNSGPKEC